MEKRWPKHFFVARNTAVRGAEVHSLETLLYYQYLNLLQAMDCRHMAILEPHFPGSAVDWENSLLNYNYPGGWKAVAPEGLPEGKESILHNFQL